MRAFSVILLGVATNLDNLLLGILYGCQGKRISFLSNVCIALGSAAASFICCYLASFCQGLGRLPNILGACLIIFLGIWPLLPRREKKPAPECLGEAAQKRPVFLSWRETALLTCTLAVNCLAASFGAGLTGLHAVPVALLVGGCSFLAVGAGNRTGLAAIMRIREGTLNAAASVVMIALGVLELFI